MRKLVFIPLIFLLAACAQMPLFRRAPKKPAPEPAPPPVAERAQKVSAVVNFAPDFTFDAPGKARSLRSLRGQAVVLVFGREAGSGAFKKQLKELAPLYQELASKRVIFVAALQEGEAPVQSNIPFVIANDGAAVAGRYGVTEKFAIAIIAPDGNIDYQTTRSLPGGRVRDVIQNSFLVQDTARKH